MLTDRSLRRFFQHMRMGCSWVTHLVLSRRPAAACSGKVFGIGFNRTGTTTLETVLRELGYRMPDQALQERVVSSAYTTGRYADLVRFMSNYDAFQDMPLSQESIYVALDALFPNSRFILTVRDPDQWYASMVRFYCKWTGVNAITDITPERLDASFHHVRVGYVRNTQVRFLTKFRPQPTVDWSLFLDRELYQQAYQQRNEEIQRYFLERPGQLLVIDLTQEPDTRRICEFLGQPSTQSRPMPWKHRS